ncbi:TlpA disulfide reductase family protein [uncultured Jannaschia sp.]|uniref:TlpA family protein disulfide reductase n=1 Tax=uncultured Jannaschia sp. TaxID=293347 RepID=UPI002633F3E6|nr:TlpA disulfide reductase family protein [uncultured Jannaschia sp.]
MPDLRSLLVPAYLLAALLATPATALDETLLTGTMEKMRVLDAGAPAATAYVRADGEAGDLSDHAGQVVVLNFWATWCAPCRAEMPSLQALQNSLGDEGVEVVTMAFGRHNPAQMQRFWEETGITSLPLHRDPDASLARALGVVGLPHTVILGADGDIVAELAGEADWSAPETLALLRSLLPQ